MNPRMSIDEAYWAMMAAAHLPGEQYTDPPGDRGLFGPDSAIWHVHGDVSAVLGGVSGLILGTLNEPVTHGTNRFSDYLQDPIKRLGFTASFVLGMTYGSTPVAERLAGTVRAMHQRVQGAMPDGRAFSATDPDDIVWVGITQAYSVARAHVAYHPHPLRGPDLDRYFAEYAVINEMLGAPDSPRTLAEAEDYFTAMRPRLTVSEEVLQAVEFLRRPKGGTPATRMSSALLARVATGLLPDWALTLLGGRPPLPRATRIAGHALIRTLRYGVRYPMIDEARARCAAASAETAA
ncbi:oxygenase MpaB family protein [Actinoallomurus sp. CA-150999]|uniref:oxygenase MpaB family protein n=1 Tax=Actinoallomurus sp. CA-150999 TaxID=3239887 RepID=UPI003D8FAD81